MTNQTIFTLTNPKNGSLSFKLLSFEDNSYFDHIQRNNYYSIVWIPKGTGTLKVDFSEYNFKQNSLFAFAPYQPFMFSSDNLNGIAIQFHHDFFCIYKHQEEVSCNGILFNNIYDPPFVLADGTAALKINLLIEQLKAELVNAALAQFDSVIAYLKILLITASRLKITQTLEEPKNDKQHKKPVILQNLKNVIERDFKISHSPSYYAEALNVSAKTLSKIVKTHLNKTLTGLITERVIMEAKRELYVTNKSVKEIAHELGYEDEHYFSRFFKLNTDLSPQLYRENVNIG